MRAIDAYSAGVRSGMEQFTQNVYKSHRQAEDRSKRREKKFALPRFGISPTIPSTAASVYYTGVYSIWLPISHLISQLSIVGYLTIKIQVNKHEKHVIEHEVPATARCPYPSRRGLLVVRGLEAGGCKWGRTNTDICFAADQ